MNETPDEVPVLVTDLGTATEPIEMDAPMDGLDEEEQVTWWQSSPTSEADKTENVPTLGIPTLPLPRALAHEAPETLQEVSSTIAGMAGQEVGEDLSHIVSSLASTPRSIAPPDHYTHTGLGCASGYALFTKGPDGKLIMQPPFETSKAVLYLRGIHQSILRNHGLGTSTRRSNTSQRTCCGYAVASV